MNQIIDFINHLFTPKESNSFKAKVLHLDFLSVYLLFAIVIAFSFKSISSPFTAILGFATDITVNKLYELTNNERKNQNLAALNYSEKLAFAAQLKARDMFDNNYWAHYSPLGKAPWDFILAADYRYEYAGENLAKNFLFSQGVIDAWMASPTHRENIIKSEYTDVGYAVVNGILNGEETTLVVQMFGKPINPPIQAKDQTIPIKTEKIESPVEKPVQASDSVPEGNTIILADKSQTKESKSFVGSLNINLVFIFFLLMALLLDFYYASRLDIVRFGGKNIAHFIFIIFIFLSLFLLTKGSIV